MNVRGLLFMALNALGATARRLTYLEKDLGQFRDGFHRSDNFIGVEFRETRSIPF